jgi:hypothetical protein
MKQKFITNWFYSPIANNTEHKLTGLWFWKSVKKVVQSIPQAADYDHFCEQLQKIYNEFDENGYDVVNIIPLNLGTSEPNHAIMENGKKNYLGETGYSITRGTVVVGKLRVQ